MSTPDPRGGSTRVEREIREILERVDTAPTPSKAPLHRSGESPIEQLQATVRRQRATARAQVSRAGKPTISPDLARIGGALLLAIAAAALADASRLLAIVLAIGAVVAFFSLWMPNRPGGLGDSPRWRGQDLQGPGGSRGFDAERFWPPRNPKRRSE
jgi:hypothetical protein